jgi:hypothetical protein
MKTYQWLTLVAAVLITLCEVLVFNRQSNAAAATDLGSGGEMRPSPAEAASIHQVLPATGARSPGRVR